MTISTMTATKRTSYTPIPGPRPMPLLGWRGNVLRLARDPLGYMLLLHREFGEFAAFINTPDPGALTRPMFVYLFSPALNQQLLSDTTLFHDAVRALSSAIADTPQFAQLFGLVAMSGEKHKQQRRLMLPAFHRQAVTGYRDIIVAETQQLMAHWAQHNVDQTFNMAHEMQQVTLRIATKALFGIHAANDAFNQIGEQLKHFQDLVLSPGVALLPRRWPGAPYQQALHRANRIIADLQALIERKRQESGVAQDALALLIGAQDEDGSKLSDADLVAQASVMFVAGHETSANALTWTLLLLAQHPEILGTLCEELQGVLKGEPPTVEQLNGLPLLDAVLKESLRLLPPLAFNVRQATADFALGDYYLPKGTVVNYSEYITHRLPELYTEPNRFLPQRWATITPSPYAYLPFGGGARMCIGATFAQFEIKVILATLLQHYRANLLPNTRVDRKLRVVLEPKGGLPMHLVDRNKPFLKQPIQGNIHEMVDL